MNIMHDKVEGMFDFQSGDIGYCFEILMKRVDVYKLMLKGPVS